MASRLPNLPDPIPPQSRADDASRQTEHARSPVRGFAIAWLFTSIFYFLEYAVRSSPSVMIPQLASSFGTTALGVSSILVLYYYTYSITSLVAGASLDHLGAKRPIPLGTAILAVGVCCSACLPCWLVMSGGCSREPAPPLPLPARFTSPHVDFQPGIWQPRSALLNVLACWAVRRDSLQLVQWLSEGWA